VLLQHPSLSSRKILRVVDVAETRLVTGLLELYQFRPNLSTGSWCG